MATVTAQSSEIEQKAKFAKEAIEDGVHAAKRAFVKVRRRVEDLGELKDDAVYRMKKAPLKSAGIALAVGVLLGVAVGWFAARPRRQV